MREENRCRWQRNAGGSGSGGGGGASAGAFRGFASTAADGNVAESSAVSPVTATGFAEVTRLREVVVVVVTELSVGRVAARTRELLLLLVGGRRKPCYHAVRSHRYLSWFAGVRHHHGVWKEEAFLVCVFWAQRLELYMEETCADRENGVWRRKSGFF